MIKKILSLWPIILLIFLSFLLRIYKLEEFFYFSYDEEIPAFVGRKLVLFKDISLLGGVTPFGFHLAPYFYWFLASLLFIGNLNPLIWGWASAVISTITTLMMYKVGKDLFNKKIGFLASSFWAFSYLANLYDRHLWALYWGPLISLVVIYSLHKIIKGNEKFTYLLGITLAFAIHTDLSSLIFIILAPIVWFIYKIPFKKSTLIALLIIIASFAPLVIFDLTHNFANTKPAIEYFKKGIEHSANNPQGFIENSLIFPQTFARLIYATSDNEIAKNYSYCPNYAFTKLKNTPAIFTLITSLVLLSFLIKSIKAPLQLKIISLLVIFYFIGVQIFGTLFKSDVFEHYLTGLFAIFLLIFAYYVGKLPSKLSFLVLALFIVFNLQKLLLAKNSIGLSYKKQAIEYAMQKTRSKDFSLESTSTCWKYSGYRYLFAVFGKEPIKSYVDPNLGHLYGSTQIAQSHPETIVTFITHDFSAETDEFYKRYARLKAHSVESQIFGNIEVIILDNSNQWFY